MSEAEAALETLIVSRAEYGALDAIRGLEASVHSMVMCAKLKSDGSWILKGSPSAFEALARDLCDEIYEELSPPSRLKHLRKLYRRLEPDGEF